MASRSEQMIVCCHLGFGKFATKPKTSRQAQTATIVYTICSQGGSLPPIPFPCFTGSSNRRQFPNSAKIENHIGKSPLSTPKQQCLLDPLKLGPFAPVCSMSSSQPKITRRISISCQCYMCFSSFTAQFFATVFTYLFPAKSRIDSKVPHAADHTR